MMERLFCDLHIHSCLSPCGDALMTPNNIAGMAFIKGLDVIAVCDHNSARNLPAVKAAADRMNVLLLPGMELTTREEAHMLCYFRTVQACMAFGEAIYAHLAPTPNNERFFGRQQVMNERDEEIDVEERLLIGALDLPFEACAARIREAGGLCVPAHINRGSSGVLGALGLSAAGRSLRRAGGQPGCSADGGCDRVQAAPLVGRAQPGADAGAGVCAGSKDAQRGRGV